MDSDVIEDYPMNPKKITPEQLEALGFRKQSLAKVIRAKCLQCAGHSMVDVRKCSQTVCANWPYRMGSDPFSCRRGSSDNEALFRARAARAARREARKG